MVTRWRVLKISRHWALRLMVVGRSSDATFSFKKLGQTTSSCQQQQPLLRQTARFYSSVDSTTTDADDEASNAKTATKSVQRPQFPWRHETSDNLLPRLEPGTPECMADLVPPLRLQNFIAWFYLQVPFWQAIAGSGGPFREELAASCGYAFAQGVAGIVSNVYKMPVKIDSETAQLNFNYDPAAAASDDADEDETSKKKFSPPEVEYMLDRPLRNLYKSAHESGRNQLQIRLEMKPVRFFLYSIFGLPFLSRQATERDPALTKRMYNIIRTMRTSPGAAISDLNEYVNEQFDKNEELHTTLEIQVVGTCDEIFQVFDRESGALLQGSVDGKIRQAVHVVRLESTISTKFSGNRWFPDIKQGNWIITDIDDLVGGKRWYEA